MKIVFLQDDFPPRSFGGAGISTYELALGMRKAGHEVFVITTVRKASDAGESLYQGLTLHAIASDYPDRWRGYVSVNNARVVRKVDAILGRIKPDVVHANNVHQYLSYASLRVAKRHTKALVLTMRDTMAVSFGKLGTKKYLNTFDARISWRDNLAQAGKRYNPLRNFFIGRYLRSVDKIFAISASLQRALEQNGIQGVEVIYNGIDASGWDIAPEKVEAFRAKHNLAGKKVLLFGPGRLSPGKGVEKTVEALPQIAKEVPNTILLFAGTIDWYAKKVQQRAQELGVAERLVFTGWIERDEVKLAYSSADVVLMSSLYLDPFGRVNIEAMAAHKPVVGTCYGGTPEIVEDGVTGFIVNPFHTEELAQKCIDLLKNPDKAKQFGEAGYRRALEKFNLDEKVEKYLLCYQGLLKNKS